MAAEKCPFLSYQPESGGFPAEQLAYADPTFELSKVRLPATGAEVTILTDRAAVVLALSDPRFSVLVDTPYADRGNGFRSEQDPGKLDKPAITEIRRPLGAPLSERALAKRRDEVEKSARKAAADFAALPRPSDITSQYCELLVADLATSTLGVPNGEWPYIKWLADATIGTAVEGANDQQSIAHAWEALYEYCDKLTEDKRQHPDGSVFSDIVASLDRSGLTKGQTMHTTSALLIGLPSVLPVLSVSICELLKRPDVVDTCIHNPDLWTSVVDELLRYKAHFSLASPRVATEDIDLGNGRILRAGEVVIPSLTAAAHDPSRVDLPDEFDFNQKAARRIVFGSGSHFCPGAPMSKQWLEIAISELFTTLPSLRLAIPEDDLIWQKGSLSAPESIPVI
jgi:cytochrome P450